MSFHDNLLSRKGRTRTAATAKAQLQIAQEIERTKAFDIAAPTTSAPPGEVPARTAEPGYGGPSGDVAERSQIAVPSPSEPPFSVRSLSERWGCSEGAVRSVIRSGNLGHFRVGDLIRVPAEEVRRFECRR